MYSPVFRIPQHWRSEAADLGQFAEPGAARVEVARAREGREESRLGEVEQQLVELFQQSHS